MSVEMNEFDENRINIIPDNSATPEDGIPGGEPVTEPEVSDAEQADSIASIEKIAAEFSAEDVPEAESEEHLDEANSGSASEESGTDSEETPEEMDMEEAALVARTLAKAMVAAEQRAAQKRPCLPLRNSSGKGWC